MDRTPPIPNDATGAEDAELCMGIQFNPPEWNDVAHSLVQAVLLGIMGGTVPRLTKDRIREKEAGLDVDERYEMGLDRDDYEDEFGYAEGYVCATCDNTNEVRKYIRSTTWAQYWYCTTGYTKTCLMAQRIQYAERVRLHYFRPHEQSKPSVCYLRNYVRLESMSLFL